MKLPEISTRIEFEITDKRIRFAGIFIIVFVCMFLVVYPFFTLMGTTSAIKTQTAVTRTIYETIDVKAIAIRKETVLNHTYSGTIVPTITNGSKVAVGDAVADIYQDEVKAGYAERLRELEDEIEYYKTVSLNSQLTHQTDITVYKNKVTDILFSLSDTVEKNELSEIYSLSRELREAITKKQLGTGQAIDVNPIINSLMSEYDSIKSAAIPSSSISADTAGYYVNTVDGFENNVDYSEVEKLGPSGVEALLNASPSQVSQYNVGKLITDFNWYLVCNTTMEKLAGKTKGSYVNVVFGNSQIDELRMKIEAINIEEGSDRITLILSSNIMNEDIAQLRTVAVKIKVGSVSGLAVDRMALRTVDGVKGVYVKVGNIVEFKKVLIDYSDANIVLSGDDGETSGLLKLYDEIILEGTDLYDSKLLT